jgi:hypothetical protein
LAMRDPNYINPTERILPDDQYRKYTKERTIQELRDDTYKLARRVELVEREKDRQDTKQQKQGDKLKWHGKYMILLAIINIILIIAWYRK